VVYAIFMRDETASTTVNMTLLDPGGATLSSWTHNCTVNISGSYWTYTRTLPAIPGTYTFKAVYNGSTCTRTFKIDCSKPTAGVAGYEDLSVVQVSPNPARKFVLISGQGLMNGTCIYTLCNVLGEVITTGSSAIVNGALGARLDLSGFPAGTYLLSIGMGNSKTVRRVVKLD
jgi:hypothetical protein